MSLGRQYENRILENVQGVFVAIIAGAFAAIGETMSEVTDVGNAPETTEFSLDVLLFTIRHYPTIIAVAGLLIVIVAAGPFGVFGFLFEAAGANLFLSYPIAALVLFAIGAGIIVVGSRLWTWTGFIEWSLSKRRGHRRRRW